MREIRQSGSEGGGTLISSPYPYRQEATDVRSPEIWLIGGADALRSRSSRSSTLTCRCCRLRIVVISTTGSVS